MSTNRPAALVVALGVWLAACDGSDAPKPVNLDPPAASASPTASAAPIQPASAHTPGPRLPPGHPPIPEASALPSGHPPIESQGPGAMGVVPPAAARGGRGIDWAAPEGWVAQQPSSAMRLAQYKVPGPAGDGECAVFYFGPGQGGDALSNAKRWAGQFRLADGNDGQSAMKTREMAVGEIRVLLVEVAGTYVGGMGTAGGEKQGYALLGAIAQGPDANWFFKLTGPEKTVASQKDAFEKMIRSLKKGA